MPRGVEPGVPRARPRPSPSCGCCDPSTSPASVPRSPASVPRSPDLDRSSAPAPHFGCGSPSPSTWREWRPENLLNSRTGHLGPRGSLSARSPFGGVPEPPTSSPSSGSQLCLTGTSEVDGTTPPKSGPLDYERRPTR